MQWIVVSHVFLTPNCIFQHFKSTKHEKTIKTLKKKQKMIIKILTFHISPHPLICCFTNVSALIFDVCINSLVTFLESADSLTYSTDFLCFLLRRWTLCFVILYLVTDTKLTLFKLFLGTEMEDGKSDIPVLKRASYWSVASSPSTTLYSSSPREVFEVCL